MKLRLPLILLLNTVGLAFFSQYLPARHGFWFPLDSAIFYFFNQGLTESRSYARRLAIINNRAFQACYLLAMGCLMLRFWRADDLHQHRRIVIDAGGHPYRQSAGSQPNAG